MLTHPALPAESYLPPAECLHVASSHLHCHDEQPHLAPAPLLATLPAQQACPGVLSQKEIELQLADPQHPAPSAPVAEAGHLAVILQSWAAVAEACSVLNLGHLVQVVHCCQGRPKHWSGRPGKAGHYQDFESQGELQQRLACLG